MEYDLIVIGTGPGGEKGAVKAAYFGYKVAIVEKETIFGGAEVVTGTLPSKTLKETAIYLSGKYEKGLFGVDRTLQHAASLHDFMYRKNFVTASAAQETRENLERHGVDIHQGVGSFQDAHTICITSKDRTYTIRGKYILIATGSYPFHPKEIPFDGIRVHDSDTVLEIQKIPSSICIVGAGVIGCEYATIFATMGTKVHLINSKETILPQIDQEIAKSLLCRMKEEGIEIHLNENVTDLYVPPNEKDPLRITLSKNSTIECDMYLFAAGRNGSTSLLHCEKAGITIGKRETLEVDREYRTSVSHIFAVGDVIGFPALASTSMDQGRVAIAHMFKTKDLQHLPTSFPYGIYTIPEVSTVGLSEEQLIEHSISYGVGRARYSDMARGKIMGAKHGFMKLLFYKDTLQICGVHIIGHIASELIHFGLELVESKQTLYDVIGKIFNFPTLHDLYKYAAYDGLSNLTGHKIKP